MWLFACGFPQVYGFLVETPVARSRPSIEGQWSSASRAARLGCAAGSDSVTRAGTQSSYPDRAAAAAMLAKTPSCSDEDINRCMSGNLCRCGMYGRIKKAIHRASLAIVDGGAK